jgi:PAS domain S-box-containing protein
VNAAGGGYVEVNDCFCAMLGYTRDELLRVNWRELTHPDDVATDIAEVNKLLSGESDAYGRDKRYIRKDGSVLWVLLSASCVRRPDRSVEYIVAIVKDITERKDAEEDLAAAHRQLNRHVTNTPLALVEWDGDYRVTRFTARATEMFGWMDHEVIGKRIDEVPWIPEEDWPKVRAVMNAMASGARPNNVNLDRDVRKDGTVIHCEWYNSSLYGPDGKLVSVLSLVQDVTAKVTAEAALREREAKLQAYFNTPAVGIAVSSPGKAWVEVNDTFCAMLGYSRDELQRLTWAELTHPDDVEADVREFNRVLAGESEGYSIDKRYIRKDGRILWVLLAVSCVRLPDRSVEFFVAVARDVTDRKMAEEAVAASEAKYRGLFDSLMDGFAVVDMDGVIQETNDVYRKMLGYSAEELAQLTYKDLTPERWHPVEERIVAEQVLPRGYSDIYEKEYRRRDGTVFPVELRTFLMTERGRPVAMWAMVRDVTEARSLQKKVAVAGRMAALGTLVSGVAHEINNPLAAEMADQGIALEVVREVREHLRTDSLIDKGAEGRALDGVVEALEDAQEGGARIARIIMDLAVFGRPDANRQRARMMDIVDGALRWLPATVARSAAIEVENGGAPDVIASPGQIEQILVNLVTNAARATPEGRRDTVIVRVGKGQPGMARVEVIDHGIGIDPAIRDHIFDPFFTTRPAGPERGTGLGLAICQAIVTAHEGTLTFESEVGKGSTFRLELPAAPAEA